MSKSDCRLSRLRNQIMIFPLTQKLGQPVWLVVVFHGHGAGVEEDQDDHEPEPGGGLQRDGVSANNKPLINSFTLQHRRIKNLNFFSCFHNSLLAASSAAAVKKSLSINVRIFV